MGPARTGRTASAGWTEARTLGVACLASGTVSLASAVVPFSDTAPTTLATGAGLLGLALGAGLLRAGDRLPPLAVHGLLAFASTVITLLLLAATTDAGRVVTAFSYLWLAMFTAWFHTRAVAAAHLSAIGGGWALVLAVSDAPAPVQSWGFVMVSVAGVAAVANHLVGSLRALAERDQLTGLLTRSAFASAAERYMTLAERSGHPLALALIDLDDFKGVNDRHGHAAGDRLLADTAAAWTGAVRRGDVLGRHGGDEFVLLMPSTTALDAQLVLQRLADSSITGWSVGVARWEGDGLDDWLRRADGELYADKRRRGRQRGDAVLWRQVLAGPSTGTGTEVRHGSAARRDQAGAGRRE